MARSWKPDDLVRRSGNKAHKATDAIRSHMEFVPDIDTAEHDRLYKTFHVRRTRKPKKHKKHHPHLQWQCACNRWHKIGIQVQAETSQGMACPLCGDLPPAPPDLRGPIR